MYKEIEVRNLIKKDGKIKKEREREFLNLNIYTTCNISTT